MAITHIVLFQFKTGLDPADVKKACEEVISLKDTCIHPSSQRPYIKSFRGGSDNSPEGAQKGITHALVAEFETVADRDYYISADPVHLALNKHLAELVEAFQVVDFTEGVYA
ncbi:dabb-domain-containing protein [Aspergillus californicus]